MATCSKHTRQPYVMVCYSCDKSYQFVCCKCIAKEHKGHDLETFEAAANNVLERLRKEKANISPNVREIHVELQNCATMQENERKISESMKQYINRRRELLKLAVDEAAEILLQKQESSDKRVMDVLLCGKQQAEDKVRNILEFQSKLAVLETYTDYKQVIQFGKQMHLSNISKPLCPIPAVTRHTLRCQKTVDRKTVKELFGKELEEDLRGLYILHCFEGKEGSDTESISTTDLYPEEMTERDNDAVDSQDAESDGNVGNRQNASRRQEVLQTSAIVQNDNQIPRSRDPVSSNIISESGAAGRREITIQRKYGVEYPNVFGETSVYSVPESRKLESQESTTRNSVRELNILQPPEENIGLASTNNVLGNSKTETEKNKSVLHTGISNEYYV